MHYSFWHPGGGRRHVVPDPRCHEPRKYRDGTRSHQHQLPLLADALSVPGRLSLGGQMFFLQEYTWDVVLHQTQAYIAMGIGVPVLLALFWQASRFKWAATTAATLYMLS